MRQLFPTGLLVLAAACGTPPSTPETPMDRTVTEADLDSLPVLTVTNGPLLCTAIGADDCPLESAVANRLDEHRIAIWEPGRTIRVWAPGDSVGTPVGAPGPKGRPYRTAIAIAANGSGYDVIVADSGWRQLAFDADGSLRDTVPLPVDDPMTVLGYVGKQPVRQRLTGWAGSPGTELEFAL